MNRIVVTGLGVISKLGMSILDLDHALQNNLSAIGFIEDFATHGLRSQVGALIDTEQLSPLPRKLDRYLSRAGLFAWHAAQQALLDAQDIFSAYTRDRIGLIIGQMSGPSHSMTEMYQTYATRGAGRMSPFMVPQTMASSASSVLSIGLGIEGISQTIAAACSSSAYAIMQACDEIRLGRHDCMIVGGVEEVPWEFAGIFDAMGALSTHYNQTPHLASRPFDKARDGFVIAEGAAFLILETLEKAQARGAHTYGEILGYAATSDGKDMVAPSGIGAARAMQQAFQQARQQTNLPIDYINAHATSTQTGDVIEAKAIYDVFNTIQPNLPYVSSTKELSGHLLGASGCFELLASLLMLKNQYITGCTNILELDDTTKLIPIVKQTQRLPIQTIMSNSFGFGGVNACIVASKVM